MIKALLVLVLLGLAFPGLAGLSAPVRGETLRIGTDARYPPFAYFTAEGRLTGFEVDLGNQICDSLDAVCQWVDIPFGQLVQALRDGRIDAVMASFAITEERRRLVAFSAKYYSTPIRFLADRAETAPITADSLAGRRIGVVIGTTHVDHLLRTYGPAVKPTLFETQGEMLEALVAGRLDLVLADGLGLWHFLNTPQGAGFAWIGNPLYVDEGIGVAMRPGDTDLVERVDAAIDRLLRNGTFLRVNSRYFPFNIY